MSKKEFKPERLKEARELRGYTMTLLAEVVDVSRQAISQFESGITTPSTANIIKIANFLKMPLEYFYTDRPRKNKLTSPIYFRRLNSATKKDRTKAMKYEEWLIDIHDYISEYLKLPSTNIPEIDKDFLEINDDDIEQISEYVRNKWGLGLGPISNVALLLENNGVILGNMNISKDLDSFSAWRGDFPLIIINVDKYYGARIRFDLAHELGHLILHKDVDWEHFEDKQIHNLIELQANKFASAFLIPSRKFVEDFIDNSLDSLIYLKRKWLISIASLAMRAHDLKFINENQKSYIFQQLANYRRKEPYDEEIAKEKPLLLSRGIEMLVSKGIKTKYDILKDIALPEQDFITLSCLRHDFFDENTTDNVVELKTRD